MRTVSVYLSIVTLHVSQSPAGGFVLLCTITTITHPISIHSAPSLSEDIVVIVVQYPLKTPTRHGRTQAVKDIRLREAAGGPGLTLYRAAHQSSPSWCSLCPVEERWGRSQWCTVGSRGQGTSRPSRLLGRESAPVTRQTSPSSPVSSQTRLEANNRNTSKCILGTEHSIKLLKLS